MMMRRLPETKARLIRFVNVLQGLETHKPSYNGTSARLYQRTDMSDFEMRQRAATAGHVTA